MLSKMKCFFMDKFVTAIILILIAFSAMSQDTVYSKIEKAYNDSGRKTNSAKADVFIVGKRIHEESPIKGALSKPESKKNETSATINRRKKNK